jgi:hypothetical protein
VGCSGKWRMDDARHPDQVDPAASTLPHRASPRSGRSTAIRSRRAGGLTRDSQAHVAHDQVIASAARRSRPSGVDAGYWALSVASGPQPRLDAHLAGRMSARSSGLAEGAEHQVGHVGREIGQPPRAVAAERGRCRSAAPWSAAGAGRRSGPAPLRRQLRGEVGKCSGQVLRRSISPPRPSCGCKALAGGPWAARGLPAIRPRAADLTAPWDGVRWAAAGLRQYRPPPPPAAPPPVKNTR